MTMTTRIAGYSVTVSPGDYFLGDPCYAVPDADWNALLNTCDTFEKPVGTVHGFDVLGFGTMWGDGSYKDEQGHEYSVDAGLIGLTPLELARLEPTFDRKHLEQLGLFVTFTSPVTCTSDGGRLTFGEFVIDTTGEDGDDAYAEDSEEDHWDTDDDEEESEDA